MVSQDRRGQIRSGFFLPLFGRFWLVMVVAVLCAGAWLASAGDFSSREAVVSASAVAVAALPWVFLFSRRPVRFFTNRLARRMGLNGDFGVWMSELSARTTGVVFAGTELLRKGQPRVREVVPNPMVNITAERLLQLAAAVEGPIDHPVAAAIVGAAGARGLQTITAHRIQTFPGRGAAGRVLGIQVAVGTRALMRDKLVRLDALTEKSNRVATAGDLVVYVSIESEFAGIIIISYEPHPDAVKAVRVLHGAGFSSLLFSGVDPVSSAIFSGPESFSRIVPDLSARQKLSELKALSSSGVRTVLLAGSMEDLPLCVFADFRVYLGMAIPPMPRSVSFSAADLLSAAYFLSLVRRSGKIEFQNQRVERLVSAVTVFLAAGGFAVFGVFPSLALAFGGAALSCAFSIFNAFRLSSAFSE